MAKKLSENNRVFLTVHRKESIELLEKKIRGYKNISVFKLDINDRSDCEYIRKLNIHVLVNNAAIGSAYSLVDMPVEQLRRIYETNIFSTMELTQLVLENMIEKNYGKIVFISSLAGVFTMPFLSAYASSKSGLSYIAKCMNKELKSINKNIDVKLIELGAYSTGFNQKMYEHLKCCDSKYFDYNKIYKKINRFFLFTEIKNLKAPVNIITKAILSNDRKLLYRSPSVLGMIARLYGLFN